MPADASVPPPEALAWLALARAPGLGPVRAARLVARFGSAAAAVAAAARGHEPPPLPGLSAARGRALFAAVDLEAAALEARRGARLAARLVAFGDAAYPAAWSPAGGWPPVLWVRGTWPATLAAVQPHALAIVGSRRASDGARAFAAVVAERAAWAGVWVVSGLAFGVDAAAHEAARRAARDGAPAGTVAVLASGVDRPTPTAHRALARAILDAGGALVAAAAVGADPPPGGFPVRNRWIAGLAGAVAIVEAGERSGSLHTAAAALELGREVRVAPARPWDAHAAGSLALLRDGAAPLVAADDGWRALPGIGSRGASTPGAAAPPPWDRVLAAAPRPVEALASDAGVSLPQALAALEGGVVRGWARRVGAGAYARATSGEGPVRDAPGRVS